MTYGQANLMEAMMADRTRQVTGLWWGALALAGFAVAADLAPWLAQAAAFVQEARS